MALYPEVAAVAQAEIDSAIGPDRLPAYADRDDLPYVNALVLEVMRWHSVVPTGKLYLSNLSQLMVLIPSTDRCSPCRHKR